MGRRKIPGLQFRSGVWVIDKKVFGQRICESTGTSSFVEAEKYLVHRLEELREAKVFGVRPKRTFQEAAVKYLQENQHKASLKDDALWLGVLDKFIGKLNLESVNMGSLQDYIQARLKDNVTNRTINYGLQVVRHILNLATSEWLDEHGLTWLNSAPKIKLLSEHDKRKPYPLSWDEQHRLFREFPDHLAQMALFTVNTGCRNREVCHLKWAWETRLEGQETSVFIIPGQRVKNRDDRVVVLNRVAQSVIESVRGVHPEYVFTYHGKPTKNMLNSAWKKARIRAGLPDIRVHDLKHTFGRRLRAAGVSFEDRQDLLGHRSGRITTHYSGAEIHNLINAANKACEGNSSTSVMLLRVTQTKAISSKDTGYKTVPFSREYNETSGQISTGSHVKVT